ncbi:MAG: 2-C-methyl-D-erythritol 4-phosphate cytidylyltransferase [Lachnospiraceae bacterium]|nr:2-C-methyl-D-erythritol 4-phosphate cytidylyltransferase [Lachnospiraceae bacterium]MBP5222857.1 2-C-methyl-D-erythritol 4-phosphate cytidylyltransferase [Lachnospiraceae bacterium]
MKKSGIRCTAVILAAGTGSRMKTDVAKQFLELEGYPLIYYALNAVQQSEIIDECILVTGRDDLERMQREVVDKYRFSKVIAVIEGGSERCYSVACAMRWMTQRRKTDETERSYVFIHDGARPFLTEEILKRTFEAVQEYGACVAAMPSKDTVKIADEADFAVQTPERKRVWTVQTPQVFEGELIAGAYAAFEKADTDARENAAERVFVTDDASVVELFSDVKVKLVEGAYSNIKVTTPEDLVTARALMKSGQ